MEGFSANAASTICHSLEEQAQTAAAQLVDVITAKRGGVPELPVGPAGESNDDVALGKLAVVATRLRQFVQHIDQLAECLLDAKVVSPSLQAGLSQVLPGCQKAVAGVVEQLGTVKEETSTALVDAKLLEGYADALAAYSRVVIFATQIIGIDTEEEQDRRMDHDEARELFTSPGVVSQQVFQPGRTLVVPN